MRRSFAALPCALALILAACATSDPGLPVLPGAISAPPPPLELAGDATLTDTTWSWQGTQRANGERVVPERPDRYTLLFRPGGQVEVRADCNRGSATYRLDSSGLAIGPIALTRMGCPPGSSDAEFVRELGAVNAHAWRGNELTLMLSGNAGSMRFTTPRQ